LLDAEDPLSWSPDSQWLALFLQDSRGFSNVGVVPAAGGKPARAISFLANSGTDRIVWSPDRTYILFDSGQRTEQRGIVRVDLIPKTPVFREDQFRDLFKEPEPKAAAEKEKEKDKKPVGIIFENIRNRAARLPLGLDASSEVISPDGKTLLFTAISAGQQNLYTWPLDPLAAQTPVARQLTATPGRKSHAQFSPDGKEVFYLDSGRINVITLESRVVKPLAVTAEMDVDFSIEKKEVFSQAWNTLNDTYYDPKFHGANWEAMKEKYGPVIESSRTPDEMRRMILLMIGEMNSSHSGISPSAALAHTPTTGRPGLTVDPADFTITEVTPLGPADVAGIRKGEKLVSVNGIALNPASNIDELLQYRIGKRTLISTSVHPDVPLQPINTVTEKRLIYREWVEGRRAAVDKLSGGRLGYVHMIDMSEQSLNQLYLDLDAENHSRKGVVIDLRNNNGGFVNAYALDVFTRRPYLTMTQRDHPASPARSALGQRSLELPTVLVTNQNTLSDSEDFTEGYRTLKLGKVVGVPTAGWIIYTDSAVMIDGSVLRTPMIKIQAHDGVDMELHPRPVDVLIDTAIGDIAAGRDPQLEAAVKSLLADIGPEK
jgi:C-terminal processing protease CtpA/Prc